MHTHDRLCTEILELLQGYPGAQKYATLCCKLPNFYLHAARQQSAFEVLIELAHMFGISRDQKISPPELMWRIAHEWKRDVYRIEKPQELDRYMNNVAQALLISVTDPQRKQPH